MHIKNLDEIKCMYCSINNELKTLLLVQIIVNRECQHNQYNDAGLYERNLTGLFWPIKYSSEILNKLISNLSLY